MTRYQGGIRHDYKDTLFTESITPASPARRWSWFALGLVIPLITVSLLLVSEPNQSQTQVQAAMMVGAGSIGQPVPLTLPRLRAESSPAAELAWNDSRGLAQRNSDAVEISLKVSRGDSLDSLFRRSGLSLSDLAAMVRLPDAGRDLRLLKPGDEIQITHRDGQILSLSREIDTETILQIDRDQDNFSVNRIEREVDTRTVGAHGVIASSLFEAGTQAGLSDTVILNMAGIFQWDIDFIQDVRAGDSFTVVYEEIWRDGVKIGGGDIVAAEFINRGRPYRAARFVDSNGNSDHYTPEGLSVRKAFVRAPVSFTRISSNFNPNRRHPVLNTIRAHRGVDYAAPTGTPVQAAGDGKVIFRGVQNGYGNTIILQHGGNITTLYGHLSRFASPRVGSRVRQNETIGYVGQSGLATGPHLHYEYRLNGVHRNPRTVPLPAADPVPPQDQQRFLASTETLWRQLELYRRAYYAAVQE